MELKQIHDFKGMALREIKRKGINHEHVWKTIAKDSGIPDEHSEDIRDILYAEGLIIKTRAAKQLGDLIRGTPNISAYLLNYPVSSKNISQNITVLGDNNQVAQGHRSDLDISRIADTNSKTEQTKSKISSETWIKLITAIIGLIIVITGAYKACN